jgi:hypothetical protein
LLKATGFLPSAGAKVNWSVLLKYDVGQGLGFFTAVRVFIPLVCFNLEILLQSQGHKGGIGQGAGIIFLGMKQVVFFCVKNFHP